MYYVIYRCKYLISYLITIAYKVAKHEQTGLAQKDADA